MKTTQSIDRQKAIQSYNDIKEGKLSGVKLNPIKIIKAGSIIFIIDNRD
jgi:hypothetical protein